MRLWLKVGLSIAAFAWLVLGAVVFVDDWREADKRRADFEQAKNEWAFWIGSSCDLPSDLTIALSEELASWSPFAPSDLLSDFANVAELEARVMSDLQATNQVPTELSGFIQYRLRQAVSTLPHLSPSVDMIEGCAKDVHEAMVAFKRRVQEETDEFFDDERFDEWREVGLLERRSD